MTFKQCAMKNQRNINTIFYSFKEASLKMFEANKTRLQDKGKNKPGNEDI
jgi:hypothetical protein